MWIGVRRTIGLLVFSIWRLNKGWCSFARIYNKEKKGFETRKVFRNVKFGRKIQLSSRKIWWNEK